MMAGLISALGDATERALAEEAGTLAGAEVCGALRALMDQGERITMDLDDVYGLTEAEQEPLMVALDEAFEQWSRLVPGSADEDAAQLRLPLEGVPSVPSVEEVTRMVNGGDFSQSAGPQVGTPDTQPVPSLITKDDSRVGVHGLNPAGALSEEVRSAE